MTFEKHIANLSNKLNLNGILKKHITTTGKIDRYKPSEDEGGKCGRLSRHAENQRRIMSYFLSPAVIKLQQKC